MDSQHGTGKTGFVAYAREDETYLDQLQVGLTMLVHQKKIDVWYDRRIEAGQDWEQEIDQKINTADVILLLVSPDFLHSDYCYGKELQIALQRHRAGEARVIPIIVRPCEWWETDLAKIQALPKDDRPVSQWGDKDAAWLDVARAIRKVLDSISQESPAHSAPPTESLARKALSVEIAANLRTLQTLWDSLHNPIDYFGDQPVASPDVLPAVRLAQANPPNWRRPVYEQHVPSYVGALTEDELARVDRLYDRLIEFDALRARVKPFFSMDHNYNLDQGGKRRWAELVRFTETILHDGNPLDPTPPAPELPRTPAFAPAIGFVPLTLDAPLLNVHELVLNEAVKIAVQTGSATMTPFDLLANSDVLEGDADNVFHALSAMSRRQLITAPQDINDVHSAFEITHTGFRVALPNVIPDLDGVVDRIRRILCDLKRTTAQEVASSGISQLLIDQVALDLDRQRFIRTVRSKDGAMTIEVVSADLCD